MFQKSKHLKIYDNNAYIDPSICLKNVNSKSRNPTLCSSKFKFISFLFNLSQFTEQVLFMGCKKFANKQNKKFLSHWKPSLASALETSRERWDSREQKWCFQKENWQKEIRVYQCAAQKQCKVNQRAIPGIMQNQTLRCPERGHFYF